MIVLLKTLRKKGSKQYRQSLIAIPFLFTFSNALLGFFSIVTAIEGNYAVAACFILLAGFMDLFDGRVARALGVTSTLGMELDSLCDATSFCLAPAILLYSWRLYSTGMFGIVVLGAYICAGLFRLAKFNVMHSVREDAFIGLPTPAAAAFAASLCLSQVWFVEHGLQVVIAPLVLVATVSLIAVLMISNFTFPAAKRVSLSYLRASYPWLVGLLVLGALGVIHGYPVLFGLSLGYVLSGFTPKLRF